MAVRPTKRPFTGENSGDITDELGNNGAYIDFYHIPTGENVRFKAFLTSFDDTYSPSWEEEEAYGRMDSIAHYKRTSRSITIAFDVPSTDVVEARNNQERFARLVSMLYPTYTAIDGGASTINSSPLMKIKFMNLIQDISAEIGVDAADAGLLGYINGSVSRAIDNEQGYFRAGLYEMYPKAFSLSLTFNVLHQHPLGWSEGERRGSFRKFPYGEDLDAEIEGADAETNDGGFFSTLDEVADEIENREEYNQEIEILEDQ
jgi:hypothetical protein